jgi:hypothetical protein
VYADSSFQITNSELSYNGRYGIDFNPGGSTSCCQVNNCLFVNNSSATSNTYSDIRSNTGVLLVSNSVHGGTDHKYSIELLASAHDSVIYGMKTAGCGTANYVDGGTRNRFDNLGKESSANHTPADTLWLIGNVVDFTDTIDGSGTGVYIKKTGGSFVKLT